MSSCVESEGILAAAVILPAAAAYGAGWLAWQGGKLLIEANRAADRQIAERKRQLEEAARHRKMVAISAHRQLVDMCSQILSKFENRRDTDIIMGFTEIEQLKYDLETICKEALPDDTAQIERLTSMGYLKLDRVVRQQSQIAEMTMSESEAGLYRGLSVADLMDDIRLVVETMSVHVADGQNIAAANPDVLERMKLNEEFSLITAGIMEALETVQTLSRTYGLTTSGSAWFHSCFNGVDSQIAFLCRPTTSNKELKKGIRRLRDVLEQYETMASSIENDLERRRALYNVYVDASKALGEVVVDIKAFKSASELEEKLLYLQERAEKARECAEIYKKLGPTAYMCYAWDQELRAMGYEVHTRKKIADMARSKPVHAKVGEDKLPFYEWNNADLTQLYSVSSQCALQVIVHDDGSVSMQTIAEDEGVDVVHVQRSHCSQLRALHENLRKNWFILYDYEETETSEKIKTVAQWRTSEDNAWRAPNETIITDQRAKSKETENIKRMQ